MKHVIMLLEIAFIDYCDLIEKIKYVWSQKFVELQKA